MINNCGIEGELVNWAVDSWAYALRIKKEFKSIKDKDKNELYKIGQKLFKEEKYSEALAYLEQASQKYHPKAQFF